MNTTKRIIATIAIVFAIIFAMIATFQTAMFTETIKGTPTIEEYDTLREKTLEYAKTLEYEENDKDGIKITSVIKDDSVIITATKEYRCEIKATYPIIKTTSGLFGIDYEKGNYESVSKIDVGPLVSAVIIIIIFYSIGLYYIFYFIVWLCKKIREKVKITIKK